MHRSVYVPFILSHLAYLFISVAILCFYYYGFIMCLNASQIFCDLPFESGFRDLNFYFFVCILE